MFYIQDIERGYNNTLLDVLTSSADGAVEGGGTFAFVTTGGVQKFIENERMEHLLIKGKYELIVGIDKVTNLKTIDRLDTLQTYFPGLCVKAFLNNTSSLYHPKICWFKYEDGTARLIIGSGNLTESGLTSNIEMFCIEDLNYGGFINFKRQWDNWIFTSTYSTHNIRLLDDQDVCEKVKNNQAVYEKVKNKVYSVNRSEPQDIIVESIIENLGEEDFDEEILKSPREITSNTNNILIHEISKNGDRFSQMNFNLQVVRDFFNVYSYINSKNFTEVDIYGKNIGMENRNFVEVKSHNYRFELNGLIGKTYPKAGRPIAVFQKMSHNEYRYAIIMPNDSDFINLYNFLYRYTHIQRNDRMKVCYTNQYNLKKEVPNLRIFL